MTYKHNSVAIIYRNVLPSKKNYNLDKLERRFKNAVAESIEDGFFNFFLPYDISSDFAPIALDVLLSVQKEHPGLSVNIILEQKYEGSNFHKRIECQANSVALHPSPTPYGVDAELTEQLLAKADGVILFFERPCTEKTRVMRIANDSFIAIYNIENI